ncbi:MAG: hypothetical protein J0G29_00995 [Alphaproteobacteria bacterium]|nr:hypothetical protein [Alphaproteobacteria bacterium]OJV47138.1 MAG: hypothetical protein BGO28_01715 [Alphaproteobacteria bacterium 43-37]
MKICVKVWSVSLVLTTSLLHAQSGRDGFVPPLEGGPRAGTIPTVQNLQNDTQVQLAALRARELADQRAREADHATAAAATAGPVPAEGGNADEGPVPALRRTERLYNLSRNARAQ